MVPSLDQLHFATEEQENTVDISIDTDLIMNRVTAVIQEAYSNRDYRIAMALVTDEPVASVAKSHGTSIERLRQIWRGVRSMLKDALQSDGLSGVDEISLGAEASSR